MHFGPGATCGAPGSPGGRAGERRIHPQERKFQMRSDVNHQDLRYGKMQKAETKHLLNYKLPSVGMERVVHTGNGRADVQQRVDDCGERRQNTQHLPVPGLPPVLKASTEQSDVC